MAKEVVTGRIACKAAIIMQSKARLLKTTESFMIEYYIIAHDNPQQAMQLMETRPFKDWGKK